VKIKYIDMDWFLVFIAIVSVIIAYFIVTTSERGEVIASQQCKIIIERNEK